MKHLFSLCVVLLLIGTSPVINFAADGTPLTLDTAKTHQDIQQLVQQNTKQVNTELQALAEKHGEVPTADLLTLLTQNGKFQVSAGDKLLNIGKETWEKENGYQIMLTGLQILAESEQMAAVEKLAAERNFTEKDKQNAQKMQLLSTEVDKTEMPSAKRIRDVMTAVEEDGHYSNLVGNYLRNKFTQDGYKLVSEKFSQEKFDTFLNDAKKLMNRNLESLPAEQVLQQVQQIARSWQYAANNQPPVSTSFFNFFASKKPAPDRQLEKEAQKVMIDFINSKQCTLPADKKTAALDSLAASLQREVGGELKLYGKLLDGTDLDWSGLLAKNKYVLVEFTATWCGPCRQEIPNLKKAFEKYHGQGFDLVQVYVMEHGNDPVGAVKKLVDAEKLPWLVVSEHLTARGTDEKRAKPQSAHYGIDAVPTLVLIDSTGKVIAADNLRGNELQKKLAELLGK